MTLPRLEEIDMEAVLARRRLLHQIIYDRTATKEESNEEWALFCFSEDPQRCYKLHNPEVGEPDSLGRYCSDFYSQYLKPKPVETTL